MDDEDDRDTVTNVRMAVVGGGGVGKSAVTIQFLQHKFVEEYDPTIEEIFRKQVTLADRVFMLDILDTAGQEEYKALRETYIRERNAFIVVYSITSRKSFEQINDWYADINRAKGEDSYVLVLVGNKYDLAADQRKVQTSEGEQMANEWQCPFFETSAKTGDGIENAIRELCLLERQRKRAAGETDAASVAARPQKKKGGFCCIL